MYIEIQNKILNTIEKELKELFYNNYDKEEIISFIEGLKQELDTIDIDNL